MQGTVLFIVEVFTLIFGNTANLQCADCTLISDPRQCNTTKTCSDSREICIVVETVTSSTFQTGYRQGCTLPETCYNIEAIGFGRKRSLRHACCHGNLCNKDYPAMVSNIVQSSTVQPYAPKVCLLESVSRYHRPHSVKHNYHFFTCNETFRNARHSCGSGRHLAFGSGTSMDMILKVIRDEFHYQGPVWIGGYFKMTNHTWVWNDGSAIDLNDHFWQQGEPDNYLTPDSSGIQQHCLAINGLKWRSQNCFNKYPFICV